MELNEKIKRLETEKTDLQRKLWVAEKTNLRTSKNLEELELRVKDNPFVSSLKPGHHFTPEEIKNALQIRFAVGWKGYKFLTVKSSKTLPSYSTVCRYLRKLEFSPGLLEDFLPYLKEKIQFNGDENCLLMLDETELHPCLELDRSTGSFYGYNTLHDTDKLGKFIKSNIRLSEHSRGCI